MHQPMQGAGAQVREYDQDKARQGRDEHTADARDCTCGHGPVISEKMGDGKFRVACCYCWRRTPPRARVTYAVAAWNAGNAKV
jgi:hypothetical protein